MSANWFFDPKPYYGTREPLSETKQLENCLLALWRWSEVKPREVGLDHWRCGSQACFGGHLATWPEFQAQGIFAHGASGMPMCAGVSNGDADGYLFGDRTLFMGRGLDEGRRSDHRVIVERLQRRIEELS